MCQHWNISYMYMFIYNHVYDINELLKNYFRHTTNRDKHTYIPLAEV